MDIEFATKKGGRPKEHYLSVFNADNFSDSLVSFELESYGDTKEEAKNEAIARLEELKDKVDYAIYKLTMIA